MQGVGGEAFLPAAWRQFLNIPCRMQGHPLQDIYQVGVGGNLMQPAGGKGLGKNKLPQIRC